VRGRGLRRALLVLGSVALGVVLVGLVFRGLTADMREDADDSAAVFRTMAVERADLAETIVASGKMEPLSRVRVISEVSGIIAAVHVEEGERVRRGQPLFELDRERLAARVAERRAELQLAQAQARYDLIGRAQADRDLKKRDRGRSAELHLRGAVSAHELERAEHALRIAEIDLRDSHAETDAREAAVLRAREALRQAERDLENAIIRAPIDGIIIEREGEIGRAVADVTRSGGTVVAVIADDRRIRLIGEVDENDVARIRVDQEARISVDAFPDEAFRGRVKKISSAGTDVENISSFEVEIALEPDDRLRVGMSSDARVVIREHRQVLLVPNLAIVRREGERFVRAPAVGGAASKLVPIEAGISDGFRTIISEGLDEGAPILVPRSTSPS
jgi:HlyD family secretion protein